CEPTRRAAVRRRAAPAVYLPGTRRRGLNATARPGGRRRGAPRGRREPPATWKGWSRMPPVRRLAAALLCAATLLASGAMAQSGTLEIVEAVYFGNAVPGGPLSPGLTEWALPTEEFACYATDRDMARQ